VRQVKTNLALASNSSGRTGLLADSAIRLSTVRVELLRGTGPLRSCFTNATQAIFDPAGDATGWSKFGDEGPPSQFY
jgi:hypothetical protein